MTAERLAQIAASAHGPAVAELIAEVRRLWVREAELVSAKKRLWELVSTLIELYVSADDYHCG